MKLTRKELTQAIARYARHHGYYARTIRNTTSLRYAAIAEWIKLSPKIRKAIIACVA